MPAQTKSMAENNGATRDYFTAITCHIYLDWFEHIFEKEGRVRSICRHQHCLLPNTISQQCCSLPRIAYESA